MSREIIDAKLKEDKAAGLDGLLPETLKTFINYSLETC